MTPADSTIPRPQLPSIVEVLPAEPLLLMGAGPVPVPAEVARAGGMVINHLGESMDMVVRHIKEMARYVFQTGDDHIFGVSGPASASMEMAVGNLLWAGRKVLVLKNGWFSGRFAEMAAGVGAEVHILEALEGRPIAAGEVERRLAAERFDAVSMVQGETACGVWNTDLVEIARLAREHGALTLLDAVCTLSTMPLNKDEWGLDVVLTGSQKGLSSLPGVSLISFSPRAWEVIEGNTRPKPHWCLDALRAERFWSGHQYHYTAPVPGLLAMHEALRLIIDETLERRFERHLWSSLALQEGIEEMGLNLFTPREYRLNSVVAIEVPRGLDDAQARRYMSRMFKVEIAGSIDPDLDIVRIGQMGEQCRAPNLFRVLHALGVAFTKMGARLDLGAGMAALERSLAKHAEDVI